MDLDPLVVCGTWRPRGEEINCGWAMDTLAAVDIRIPRPLSEEMVFGMGSVFAHYPMDHLFPC